MATIDELKATAARALKAADLHGAANGYTAALRLVDSEANGEGQAPILFANRSLVLLKLGYAKRALEDAERALELTPTYPKGHFRLISALLASGRPEEACMRSEASLAALRAARCPPDQLAAVEGLAAQARAASAEEACWAAGVLVSDWSSTWGRDWHAGPTLRQKQRPIEVARTVADGECSLQGGDVEQHATGLWRRLPENCHRPSWIAWRVQVDRATGMGCANTVFCENEFSKAGGMVSTRAAVYCTIRDGEVLVSDGGNGDFHVIAKGVALGSPLRIRLEFDWTRRRFAAFVNGVRVLESGFRDPCCGGLRFCYIYNGSPGAAKWGPIWCGTANSSPSSRGKLARLDCRLMNPHEQEAPCAHRPEGADDIAGPAALGDSAYLEGLHTMS
mmetsp:Transcript_49675/g.139050  ORF Transcript_49675/g.139050 Transcript_49675/m.139050 type:complete len:392 (-) Transcript_49675:958-2133(-)